MRRASDQSDPPQSSSGYFASLIGHRGRAVLTASFWSLIAKIASAANLFIAVPFVLADLGPDLFGTWATLASLTTIVNFLDFGFGYGAMNLAAAAVGRGARHEVGIVARTSAITLVRIAASLLVIGALALPFVPWNILLGLPDAYATSARIASWVVVLVVALSIPLNLSNRLQLGIGHGKRAFRWQAVGQVMSLVATVTIARSGGSLPSCVAATIATPLIASLLNTLSFHRSLRPDGMPNTIDLRAVRKEIRAEGAQFFVIQVAAVLAFGIDLPLISALKGPGAAGNYAIVQRIFSIVPIALSLLWAPLWPVYRHAFAAGDLRWALKTLRRAAMFATSFTVVGGLTAVVMFEPLSQFWLRHSVSASAVLLFGFAGWCVLEGLGTAVATFMNAASIIDLQVRMSCVLAIVSVGFKYLAIRSFGIEMMPWATVMAYVISSVVPFLIFKNQIFDRVRLLASPTSK